MTDQLLPLFDAHMHHSLVHLDEALDSYRECGVMGGVNLWWGERYQADFGEYLQELRRREIRNIVPFYWPPWSRFVEDPEGFVSGLCHDLRRYAELGAKGIKVWKDLGMYLRHPDGTPATMDDPRLDPVWQTCAELEWIVAVHQADPARNFQADTGLTREQIFRRRNRVIAAHPGLTFLLCHAGNDIHDLALFSDLLDRFPNVISEIGRPLERDNTPDHIRAFADNYVSRLYMGADLGFHEGRPVDRKWNFEECYQPLRKRMIEAWGLSGDALERIAWRNGRDAFLDESG